MALELFSFIGKIVLKSCRPFGQYALFVVEISKTFFTMKLKASKLFVQMERIGVQSLPISMLTGFFAGAVLALQTYSGFRQLGSEAMIGPVVALTITRELGPVLTGLMVAGRCSSGIAAEIGTMRITEQLDALETLCINNFQYLIVPRVLAAVIVLPFLAIFSMAFGILGGYLVCVYVFNLNPISYLDGVKEFLTAFDIFGGLIKSSVFGFILASVGALKGFYTWGGAKGVGRSTTESVVAASIAILISNYFLAILLFETL